MISLFRLPQNIPSPDNVGRRPSSCATAGFSKLTLYRRRCLLSGEHLHSAAFTLLHAAITSQRFNFFYLLSPTCLLVRRQGEHTYKVSDSLFRHVGANFYFCKVTVASQRSLARNMYLFWLPVLYNPWRCDRISDTPSALGQIGPDERNTCRQTEISHLRNGRFAYHIPAQQTDHQPQEDLLNAAGTIEFSSTFFPSQNLFVPR